MSHIQLLRSSSKTEEEILKTLAWRFQVGIHFNLGYMQLKTLKNGFCELK